MKKSYLVWALKILLAGSFFVPLIVLPSSFVFPFIVPKIVVLRSIILLMLGLYLVLLASDWKTYKPKLFSIITASVLFFIASWIISTFAGADWTRSFWDNHERMLGTFTLMHFAVYYLIIVSVFKKKEDWYWFLKIFLGAGMIVMALGWVQYIKPDFLVNRNGNRVPSTLGNPIYYGGYALFLLFVSLLLLWQEKNKKLKFVWIFCAIASFLGVFFSGTRGTMIGLFAGVIWSFVLFLILIKEKKLRLKLGSIFLGLILLGGFVFFFRENNVIRKIPGFGRLLNTSISKDSASTRIMAWEIAIESWKEKPVFGWGPTNYYYSFNKYYKPAFLRSGYGETWFDSAHNAFLNTLACQGTVGGLAYLFIFLAPTIILFVSYKKGRIGKPFLIFGTAFVGAHFIHNFFVFENPTSYIFFFFFLALANINFNKEEEKTIVNDGQINLALAGIVFLIIGILIYSTNINPAKANTQSLEVLKKLSGGDGKSFVDYQELIKMPTPHIDDIASDWARTFGSMLSSVKKDETNKDKIVEILDFTILQLENNIARHPLDIRNNLQLAQLYQTGAEMTQKLDYLLKAEKVLTDAVQYSPDRQQTQYFLAVIKMQLGKMDEAFQLLDETIKDEPMVQEGWWRKATFYKSIGKDKEARDILIEAEAKGVTFHSEGKKIRDMILSEPQIMIETEPVKK